MKLTRSLCLTAALAACSTSPAPRPRDVGPRPPPKPQAGAVTLTIIGTNDLHGALARLPLFAGYIGNLRAARAADGGGVVLVDAGDMFQGTLESNLSEGAHVVRAYNEIGYTAAAIGNHEFDFGPVGPAATPASIEDDARGALKARASEAKFPFVSANIVDVQSGAPIKWPNMPASTLVEVAGVKVGVIGASTEATPFTTMPANFAGLKISQPAGAIADESKVLRAKGAQLIVVTAHIGSRCEKLDRPTDLSTCDSNEELFRMISDLPKGAVDVIVAGHTHAAIAHRVSDIAVIESYASGRAFGRVDLRIAPDGHVTSVKIHQPRAMCANDPATGNLVPPAECQAGAYEGKPVTPVAAVQAIVDDALATAGARRSEQLGVTLAAAVTKSYGTESIQGNWFTDLMLVAQPGSHVAVTNGGGLRADIPAGALTYGALFEAMPFDNRFAVVDVKGSHLRKLVSSNLQRGGAILSWGGLAAKARCKAGTLDLQITVAGKPLVETASYKLVTSDFLASGGDGLIGRLKLPDGAVKLTDVIIRDAMANVLRKKQGAKIDPAQYFSPVKKRMDYEGERPVTCTAPTTKTAPNREPEE
ncbi:MAG: bifunctional metallophosphatase/5'-nucleotidase [Deltaproteobacteria bacterium]|nr:bifunctional metallophosphatase/5'-nucleotidase [Deltaproteobacteria bacterium]